MASYFDMPNDCDDGEFRTIRYNDLLSPEHPAQLIKRFLQDLDVSRFETRYKVGDGQKGRSPKGIRMMLGVILYGLYSRIYSAHKIDYATENYSDFWIFTHGRRISHDKISGFVNLHEEEIKDVFLETILLAQKNKLLNFEGIYQDGFYIKANASKAKSKNMAGLNQEEKRLTESLEKILEQMQDEDGTSELEEKHDKVNNKLEEISSLKDELNKKISERTANKVPAKAKKTAEKLKINSTDKDSDNMKLKEGVYAPAYQKICASDSEADIVLASSIDGYDDEPHKMLGLFEEAQQNTKRMGEYDKSLGDANFITLENCSEFEKKDIELIGPTRSYESENKKDGDNSSPQIRFEYNEQKHCMTCSGGAVLKETEHYFDKRKSTTIYVFGNKEACMQCSLRGQCTSSSKGYRKVKIDSRLPAQQRTLARYKSEEGQVLYKKRMHVGETFQGDLKQNGKFVQFFRRGLRNVQVDSTLQDIVWNLRRIISRKGSEIAWQA